MSLAVTDGVLKRVDSWAASGKGDFTVTSLHRLLTSAHDTAFFPHPVLPCRNGKRAPAEQTINDKLSRRSLRPRSSTQKPKSSSREASQCAHFQIMLAFRRDAAMDKYCVYTSGCGGAAAYSHTTKSLATAQGHGSRALDCRFSIMSGRSEHRSRVQTSAWSPPTTVSNK